MKKANKPTLAGPEQDDAGVCTAAIRESNSQRPLIEGEDYYCEGAAMVFTAQFLLRRGYCCESGCRHCPYPKGARED